VKSPADRALHGAPDRAAHSAPDGRGLAFGRRLREDPAFRDRVARELGPTDEDHLARAARTMLDEELER
jgi:hypothetical protein